MAPENGFEPRLGKIRALGSKRGRKYLHQVLRSMNLAGAGTSGRSGFHGNRIGRGCGVGRVLARRDRFAAYRQRRVVIKSRIVKLAGKAAQGARAHLRYIQRDGVTRDGDPGRLYSAVEDQADGKAFLGRSEGDRHQFRFIVSPEDSAEYEDLKPLTRRLMARMEEDLCTRLDWVAVDHFNTGHPHTHVMLRGRDERGRDLVIARDYLASGMRERAAEIVQLDLGLRTDIEIEKRLALEVDQERLTSLDRRLLPQVDEEGLVSPANSGPFRQTLLMGRLRKLEQMGLAEEGVPGRWRVADDLEAVLRRLGERGDIIKTMHREIAAKELARAPAEQVIFEPLAGDQRPVVGRLVARGLADELRDRHYLIVDGIDGRTHYVDVGQGDAVEPIPEGAIVRVEPKRPGVREVDRTVAEVAAASGGNYSVDLHLRHDPAATEEFARAHVRRLEAMRRVMGGVERQPDGTWVIPVDHLERAGAFQQRQARDRPVAVTALSTLPLGQQIDADGATWLDRELMSNAPEPLREAGFGGEVKQAQAARRQWLLRQGLGQEVEGRLSFGRDMVATLQRRELLRIAGQLSDELSLRFVEAKAGERIEGTLRRRLDLASGRFALVEKTKEFTLVPWRPVLERHLGKPVQGWMSTDGISWSVGRQRGGPAVS